MWGEFSHLSTLKTSFEELRVELRKTWHYVLQLVVEDGEWLCCSDLVKWGGVHSATVGQNRAEPWAPWAEWRNDSADDNEAEEHNGVGPKCRPWPWPGSRKGQFPSLPCNREAGIVNTQAERWHTLNHTITPWSCSYTLIWRPLCSSSGVVAG